MQCFLTLQSITAIHQLYTALQMQGDVQKIEWELSLLLFHSLRDGYAVPYYLYYLNTAAISIIQETFHAIATDHV